jgi:hypothetical protein
MSARLATMCAVAGLLVVAAACSDDSSVSTAPKATTTSSSTTTTAPPPVTAATTPATTSVTVGIICSSAEDAAKATVAAWTANDRAAAGRCANQAVVDELFKASGVGNTWMFQGCDRSDPGVPSCAYSYDGGGAFFKIEGTEANGWKATSVSYVAD